MFEFGKYSDYKKRQKCTHPLVFLAARGAVLLFGSISKSIFYWDWQSSRIQCMNSIWFYLPILICIAVFAKIKFVTPHLDCCSYSLILLSKKPFDKIYILDYYQSCITFTLTMKVIITITLCYRNIFCHQVSHAVVIFVTRSRM